MTTDNRHDRPPPPPCHGSPPAKLRGPGRSASSVRPTKSPLASRTVWAGSVVPWVAAALLLFGPKLGVDKAAIDEVLPWLLAASGAGALHGRARASGPLGMGRPDK